MAEELPNDTLEPVSLVPVDPWVAASGLQKAIRREAEKLALGSAKTLLLTDPDRLWRRLCVTAFEDVGLGDIEGLARMTAIAGQKTWRAKHGGNELVAAHLVKRL